MAKPCGREGLFVLVKAPPSPLTLQESVTFSTFPTGMSEAFSFLLCIFKAELELQNQSRFCMYF